MVVVRHNDSVLVIGLLKDFREVPELLLETLNMPPLPLFLDGLDC